MGGDSNIRRCTRQLQIDYDIWCYIYEKLDSAIDQNLFALTCVTFRDIRNSSRKSLKLRCSTTTDFINSSIIDKLLSRHTQLQTLTLGCVDYCCHIRDSCLTPLLKYGSTLHSLHLDGCASVTVTGLILIASACPLLSVISLSLTSVSNPGLRILSKKCKSLKEVNLEYCTGVTDDGIFFLNQNCRQLRVLRISGCPNITGVGFRECSPTLARLEAYNCNLDPRTGVSQIVSGGGLEYLILGRTPPTYLTRPPVVLELIPLGGFCPKLKFLNIAWCSFSAADDVIAKISRGCPLLQEWNLTGCNGIGIYGWESIGLYCQNLEILHVADCKSLCDRGLLSIGAGCKRLSVIIVDENQYGLDGVCHFRSQRGDVEIKTVGAWDPFGVGWEVLNV
ncbi:F-box/LRR-repeat protein 12-like [Rutidosis leptorrhynchoides]|uniref:F-box/LRR-repeat protein 12-like n=1 Tax=Rutidosis leptorrhynchoides TaxID=125765 RepID=UPI003A99B5A3